MNDDTEHERKTNRSEKRIDDKNAGKKAEFNLREVFLFSYIGEPADGDKQQTDLADAFHQRLSEKVTQHKG